MTSKRDELEEKLVGQAREAIRKLLDELPDADKVTLSDMERATGVMGRRVMQETLQALVQKDEGKKVEIWCEACEVRMTARGRRRKRVVTVRGEVEIERHYDVCPACGQGRFPPG
jgi:Zn finger protein HypA/HybF involved in hydrogenase expression